MSWVVAIGVAGSVGVLVVGVSLVTPARKASGLTICPDRSVLERNGDPGAVTFYVTNAEPVMVHLACLEVQVTSSNGWKTISTERAAMFNPGAPSYPWAGGLLAGSYRTVYVQPPLEGRWRVRLTYLRQERGLYSFLVRTTALVSRLSGAFTWSSLFQWSRGNVYRLADQRQVVSQEFSQ
jgi:hypothetical protein